MGTDMTTLRLVLGDQLNPTHSWFSNVDPNVVYTLMEMRQETDYVVHHAQKVLAIFAGLRDPQRCLSLKVTVCTTSPSMILKTRSLLRSTLKSSSSTTHVRALNINSPMSGAWMLNLKPLVKV